MFLRRLALPLLACAAASCSSQGPRAPRPQSIDPNELIAGETATVSIGGSDFWTDVRARFAGSGEVRTNDTFQATLGDTPLTEVERVNSNLLTATVPGSLPVGFHDLVLTDPAGRVGRLADAVAVVALPIDSITIEDAAGGAGAEVGDVSLWLGQTLPLFAIGRMQAAFVRDEAVQWDVDGGIGSILPFEGTSTQFLAEAEGTGSVTATVGNLVDVTGTITVRTCTVDADCADPNVCNGTETCTGGRCIPGTALTCDDGDPCTDNECDPTSGCTSKPSALADADEDGFANVACNGNDCDDDPLACGAACNPGIAVDDCDGFNNDCDAQTDEDFVGQPTNCGVGACAAVGSTQCSGGVESDDCTAGAPLTLDDPTCDGVDDDCDGTPDDDYVVLSACGVGRCLATNVPSSCAAGVETACQPGPASGEGPVGDASCSNGDDDDCDGLTDGGDDGCTAGPGIDACAYVTWGTANGGTIDLTTAGDLLDPPAAGRTMAQGDWSGAASHADVGFFSSGGHGEVITAVEVGLVYYVDAPVTDDPITLTVELSGVPQGSPAVIDALAVNGRVGASRAGATFADVTAARSWTWADLDDANLTVALDAAAAAADDGSHLFVDTVGYRVLYECNTPPVARFTLSPAAGDTSTSFNLDATASSDAEDATADLQVQWDWEGDGIWNTPLTLTKAPAVSYPTTGRRTIALHVVDTGGRSGYASRPVSVADASDLLVVTTSIDEEDASETPTPPHQGTGLSLREAILLANGTAPAETIVLAPGVNAVPDTLGSLPAFSDSVTLVGDGRVLVDGANLGGDCVNVTGGNVAIWGIEVTGCSNSGISIGGSGTVVSLRDSWMHDVSVDCVFVDSQPNQIIGPGNEMGPNCRDGIRFVGNIADGATVIGNRIHDNSGNGISLGTNVSNGGSDNVIVQNVIWQNGGDGLSFSRASTGNRVLQNTVVGNGADGIVFGNGGSSVQEVAGNLLALHVSGSGIESGGSTFTSLDFNLYFANDVGACAGCPSEPSSVFLDPLFVDAAAADYSLRDDSPAVDTGTDLGMDLNGPAPGNWSRSGPDIGALEAD